MPSMKLPASPSAILLQGSLIRPWLLSAKNGDAISQLLVTRHGFTSALNAFCAAGPAVRRVAGHRSEAQRG